MQLNYPFVQCRDNLHYFLFSGTGTDGKIPYGCVCQCGMKKWDNSMEEKYDTEIASSNY